ncbi:unnamed protein product [Clonostachys rhizophaga]|uniref:Uncharacterized protein n=1 Tax=Clonostachys rhizophaga TaxID=160324 RepID=A0A9N9YQY2_9HYPO|nr:unnamed protein product [Clonostachys rhizophaga]
MVAAIQLGLAALFWLGLVKQGLALGIDQATDDLDLVARDLFGSLEKTKAQMALASKGKRDVEDLDGRDLESRLLFGSLEKTKAQMALAAKGKRASEELDELDERDLEGRLYLPDYHKYAPKKGRSLQGRLYLPDYHKYAPKKQGRSLKARRSTQN